MPVYITLIRWTDQGREKVDSLPDRVQEVEKRLTDHGAKTIGNWVTMGSYDQIAVNEAPDDETAGKLALMIAGRGNAVTQTMRAFSMDEVRRMLQG
ncbi:MAG TPA: GYD domain-containing protein [Actinomycetota bacterium]